MLETTLHRSKKTCNLTPAVVGREPQPWFGAESFLLSGAYYSVAPSTLSTGDPCGGGYCFNTNLYATILLGM